MDMGMRILIVYDQEPRAQRLVEQLAAEGKQDSLVLAQVGSKVEGILKTHYWDVIIYACDSFVAAESIVFFIRKFMPATPLIVLTETADMDLAVALMKMGASNCLSWKEVDRIGEMLEQEHEAASTKRTAYQGLEVELSLDESPGNTRSDSGIDNITDSNAALQLKRSEAYLRAVLNSLPFMVWTKDTESRYLMVNNYFAGTLGIDHPENIVGKVDTELWPADLAAAYRRDDRQVMETRKSKLVEEEIVDQGKRRWVETCKNPVIDGSGELIGTTGFARDISSRKEYEDALVNYASLLSSVLECVTGGVMAVDRNEEIVFTNREFYAMWGFEDQPGFNGDEEVLLQKAAEKVEDPTAFLCRVQAIYDDRTFEGTDIIKLKDGRSIERCTRPLRVKGKIAGRVWCFNWRDSK